ncbi:hypothetical protein Zmor_027718 [Zophobas morio]|uniref:Alkylglycerol monooxygenase n=1 Tax=Zophobas morio TaxID=2755281 RepID=A0AA38HP94_9CUCU|nr:hypothetical protein Zmor_027718 [Zophobas morio]
MLRRCCHQIEIKTEHNGPKTVPLLKWSRDSDVMAWPYFATFILLENVLLWLQRRPTFRLNDGLTSLSHGLLQECGRLLFRGGESYVYVYVYDKFRLVELPWDHWVTWYLAAVGVDFCYYWVHRACHEVHILWAQHQVHHSSEDFNLAVGLRQSVFQGWCGFVSRCGEIELSGIFYLPLAVAIPPSHFVTHQQFNLLYQFWIHTKSVRTLGPLEVVFNTPQHHRVHHGANIYCLDKNYGGVLIIWDRLFGTFAEERQDEEIVYGLVMNQPSFNLLHLQIFYLPLAVAIPPSHFVTHQQFNLLYQFWIHTKSVRTLGPLEVVFNTPQHHRVHHGANIYCLDKNYGGVLIIWDRLFGTFAEERQDEEIVYGLVMNQPSFNLLHLQTFYTLHVAEKFKQMTSWQDKLAAIFYGPSWEPGKPRLGLEQDKIKVVAREKYEVKLPLWCNVYLFIHFCFVVYGFQELAARHMSLNPVTVLAFVAYIIASLTSIGLLFDNAPYACVLELLRCMVLVTAVQRMDFPDLDDTVLLTAEVFFVLSGFFWLLQSLRILQISAKAA